MVHFFNGDKTEAYLNLVDSEIIAEADVEIVDSETAPRPQNFTSKSQEKTCLARTHLLRIFKVTLGILLLLAIVILSYSVHVQNRRIKLLQHHHHVTVDKGTVNATSMCDRSNIYYSNLEEEKHMSKNDNGAYCIDVCSHMKQISPFVNGITVLTDPTKDGCWCRNNISISTRYQSCFIRNQNTETVKPTAATDSEYECEFKPGFGSGGTEVKMGNLDGHACVKACLHFKQFDNLVNGVTVYSTPGKYGCWCEKRMRTIRNSIRSKACFLKPSVNSKEKVDPNVCAFSTGYGTGGTLMTMGKRSEKDCVEDCLHMKKIEDRVNGVTMKSKDGSCWCDVGKTNISYSLRTCLLKPSDGKCVLTDTSYQGADLKTLAGVDTWIKCSKECRVLSGCMFWTWFQTNTSCHLKRSESGHTPAKNAKSGNRNCGMDTCSFILGNGVGGTTHKIGKQTGKACVSACSDMSFHTPSINGVTVYRDRTKSSCYCRSNMTHIGGIYKTCFFNPNITLTPLTTFHDYIPDCPLQPGDGSGVGEIYLGKLGRDACRMACLHLKKIDDTINGMTVYANKSRPGCWCEQGIRNVKKSKLYYSTCVFNFKHETREKMNRRAELQCHFMHGYGAGNGEHVAHRSTRAYVGRLNEDECIEACAHLRRMDSSINGVTRNTVTGRCSCDRNMVSIGVNIKCSGSSDDTPL